jgi:zinc/manganese transport system permease protein
MSVILVLFRPLLFCSIDPDVAQARGIPVERLSMLFLILVAITVSVSVQFVGILLIFTLLVGPVATAMRIFHRPLWVILCGMLLGLVSIWGSIILAANGNWPVSFYLTAISFGVYLLVRVLSPLWVGQRKEQQTSVLFAVADTLQPERERIIATQVSGPAQEVSR